MSRNSMVMRYKYECGAIQAPGSSWWVVSANLRPQNHQISVHKLGYLRLALVGLCPKIWLFEARFLPKLGKIKRNRPSASNLNHYVLHHTWDYDRRCKADSLLLQLEELDPPKSDPNSNRTVQPNAQNARPLSLWRRCITARTTRPNIALSTMPAFDADEKAALLSRAGGCQENLLHWNNILPLLGGDEKLNMLYWRNKRRYQRLKDTPIGLSSGDPTILSVQAEAISFLGHHYIWGRFSGHQTSGASRGLQIP